MLAATGMAAITITTVVTPPTKAVATTIGSFTDSRLVGGLNSPTAMDFSPDGRLFVTEKGGNLRIIEKGVLLGTPFLSLTVDSTGERGLLGIAFDPNFSSNRYLYVYYTVPANGSTIAAHNRVSRFAADPANLDKVLLGSELPILDLEALGGAWHNGGAIHFGKDGKLYVGVGENGVSSNSQSLSTRLGKMLRINPDGTIPTDNPFYNVAGAKKEIWALGLRNPYTFAFSPSPTGPQMYINDVGQDSWEEINEGIAGANYGWPTCEGICSDSRFVNPVYTYPHNGSGKAIAGGAFYEGSQFPAEYKGSYFFGDYVADFVKRLTPDGLQAVDFLTNLSSPVDLKVGPNDGYLYYLLIGTGEVHTVQYISTTTNNNPTAITSANPTSGAAPPLMVNFDGSASTDPDNDPLTYSWNFGDGTPVVTGVTVAHTYNSSGKFIATLTVNDGRGGTSSATIDISVGSPPVGVINNPPVGTKYNAGDTIFFDGSASDAEDGQLPASAFKWVVLLHHNTHTHPFMEFDGVKNGNFTIPTISETDSDVWYRIYLNVTDSSGLSQMTTRDVLPNKVNISLNTNVQGLQLNLDGQPHTTPYAFVGVVGIIRTLGALSQQSLGGQTYQFGSWSDGGAQNHTISTPSTDTAYTASFTTTAPPPPQNLTLAINAIDTSNNVHHMWTTIRAGGSSGTLLQQGYTPVTSTGTAGSTYTVTVANYQNVVFDHWLDNNSTSSSRTVTLNSNTQLTAIYRLTSSPPPSSTYTLNVRSVDTAGNAITGYWTVLYDGSTGNVVKSGFTPASFALNSGQQYRIGMGNYGSYTFDHWQDSTNSTANPRSISISGDTTLTAVYRTTP